MTPPPTLPPRGFGPYHRGSIGDVIIRLGAICDDGQDLDPYTHNDLCRLMDDYEQMVEMVARYQDLRDS